MFAFRSPQQLRPPHPHDLRGRPTPTLRTQTRMHTHTHTHARKAPLEWTGGRTGATRRVCNGRRSGRQIPAKSCLSLSSRPRTRANSKWKVEFIDLGAQERLSTPPHEKATGVVDFQARSNLFISSLRILFLCIAFSTFFHFSNKNNFLPEKRLISSCVF